MAWSCSSGAAGASPPPISAGACWRSHGAISAWRATRRAARRGVTRAFVRVVAEAPSHVMGALPASLRRYPKLTLSLAIGNSAELLHDLLEHRSDVAILADVPGDPRLHALPLRRDR